MGLSAASFSSFGARVSAALVESFPCDVTFSDGSKAAAAWMPGGVTRQNETSGLLERLSGSLRIPTTAASVANIPAVGALIIIDGQRYRVGDVMLRPMDASWKIEVYQPGR